LVFCPAAIVWLSPFAATLAAPFRMLISMEPFFVAFRLASPIRMISVPLAVKVTPAPSGMERTTPSNGTWSHSICPRVLVK
jgi:hypothetical protein